MDKAFVCTSPVSRDLLEIIKKTASTNSPVLLLGDVGSGKKTFAELIYQNSVRRNFPFFCYNCRKGELVDLKKVCSENGVIYLEFVECLSETLQKQILEVIQEKVEIKIIAGTSEDLSVFVQNGTFSEELFFRLNVFPVRIPSLKVRKEDIVPLAEHFAGFFADEYGKNALKFSDGAKKALEDYQWPGNILELKDVVSRCVLICRNSVVQTSDLHLAAVPQKTSEELEFSFEDEDKTLKTALNVFKRQYVLKILDECGWNQTKAGKMLGIQRTYVSRLMKELHIREINNRLD